MNTADRIRGCLLGGAVGDALGAPVEFMRLAEIRRQFGLAGIREYAPAFGRLGAITDDTQMTLFTAEGLLRGYVRGASKGIVSFPSVVSAAYQRWLLTQGGTPCAEDVADGWLITHRELFSRRAPGTTCLGALRNMRQFGEKARNDSKGCGAVMRVAPVGMFATAYNMDPAWIFNLGAEIASLTHGHPTALASSGTLAVIIANLVDDKSLPEALAVAKQELVRHSGHEETLAAIATAERLSDEEPNNAEAIRKIGEGWISEEALAIAIYCAMSADAFESSIVLAVNHDGDSDSTGSITGNLAGAVFGVAAIPERWLAPLELRSAIEDAADDLAALQQVHVDGFSHLEDINRITERYPGH